VVFSVLIGGFRFRQAPITFVLLSCAVIGILAVVSGVLFSHRIAGPIYRLNQQMEKDAKLREVNLVSFRKGDFFPELAGSYNVLSRAMRSTRSE
jgi:hypothetical protein